jgi:uncharacterized OsmC-like protein
VNGQQVATKAARIANRSSPVIGSAGNNLCFQESLQIKEVVEMTEVAKEATEEILNGVNVDAVKNLIGTLREKQDLAKSKFRVSNKWINGGHNRTTISDFYGAGKDISHIQTFVLDADEPPILAGEDKGANPVEHLLNALAACLTTTMVYHAAVRGIRLEEVEAELEGHLDLRGFLAISDDVRNGYQEIRVKYKVKTDAENVERLKALAKLSPVFDVVSNGTRVDVQIEKK